MEHNLFFSRKFTNFLFVCFVLLLSHGVADCSITNYEKIAVLDDTDLNNCKNTHDCAACLNFLNKQFPYDPAGPSPIATTLQFISQGIRGYHECTQIGDPVKELQDLKKALESLMKLTTSQWTDSDTTLLDHMYRFEVLPMVAKKMKENRFPAQVAGFSPYYQYTEMGGNFGHCWSVTVESMEKVLNSHTGINCLRDAVEQGRSMACPSADLELLQDQCYMAVNATRNFQALRVETYDASFYPHYVIPEVVRSKWTITLWIDGLESTVYSFTIPDISAVFADSEFVGWPTIPTETKDAQQGSVQYKIPSQSYSVKTFNRSEIEMSPLSLKPNSIQSPIAAANSFTYRCVKPSLHLREMWFDEDCASELKPVQTLYTLQCDCSGDGPYTVIAYRTGYNPYPDGEPPRTTTPVPTNELPGTTTTPPDTPTITSTSSETPATTPESGAEPTKKPRDASPILIGIIGNYTQNSTDWIIETPGLVLDVVKNLTKEQNITKEPIDFDNVVVVVEIIDKVVIADPLLPINMTAIVDTMLDIYNEMLHWDIQDGTLLPPVDPDEARRTEQELYEVLETIPSMLPNRSEPYEFQKTLISVSVLVWQLNSSSSFDDLSGMKNAILVDKFQSRDTLSSTYKFVPEDLDETGIVADFRLSVSSIRNEFELAKASDGVFTVMLASLERFKYQHFDHSLIHHRESKSRKVSPLLFMGQFNRPISANESATSFRMQADALFKTPEGGRYHGSGHYACVFFDYNLTETIGGWSNKGCRLVRKHTTWERGTTVECECDHLTPFSVFFYLCDTLVDLDEKIPPALSEQFSELEPRLITAFSLSISIICITIVLLHMGWKLYKKYLRLTPLNFTRLNVVASLLVSNVAFLASEYIPDHENYDSCLATALFSHWFMLASFFWMSAETYFLMKIIRGTIEVNYTNRDTYDGIRWRVALLAWGAPFVFPFLSILSHIDSATDGMGGQAYGSLTMWCWIDPQHHAFFLTTFVIPICAIALLNISVFAYYLYKQKEAQIEAGQKRNIRQGTISILGTCLLLGASWLSAYLMLMMCCDDTAKQVAGVFYILLNALQGAFVLWVYVTRLDGGFRSVIRDFKQATGSLFNRASKDSSGQRKSFRMSHVKERGGEKSPVKKGGNINAEKDMSTMSSARTFVTTTNSLERDDELGPAANGPVNTPPITRSIRHVVNHVKQTGASLFKRKGHREKSSVAGKDKKKSFTLFRWKSSPASNVVDDIARDDSSSLSSDSPGSRKDLAAMPSVETVISMTDSELTEGNASAGTTRTIDTKYIRANFDLNKVDKKLAEPDVKKSS